MTGTIAPVREIVIVIRDLYLEPELTARPEASAAKLAPPSAAASRPGAGLGPDEDSDAALSVEYLARFGDKKTLPEGWRAWVAHWLGLPQYAQVAPASVAAAVLPDAPADSPTKQPGMAPGSPPNDPPVNAPTHPSSDRVFWLATPVHLIAGLTSLHVDRRSILRLPITELTELATSFRDTFRGSGFDLHPLEDGELLLSGPPMSALSITTEPARMLVASVAEALPTGEGAPALRRLSAEIEMWLHGHGVNDRRARRGDPPVATLWLWGGGAAATSRSVASREITEAAFGSDAYVRGLWRLAGGETRPMPVDWAAVIGEPRAQRALGVVEVAELLHTNPSWNLADAVAEIDRRLISPSLAALRRGELDRLVLLANDRALTLRRADRWRLWRYMRTVRKGVEVLA